MKRNPEFVLSTLAGRSILVPIGERTADFNAVVALNDMGTELWEMLENEKTREEIVAAVLDAYDVTPERAAADIRAFLTLLCEKGCVLE